MTNREFADFIISKIEHHKHKLCDGKHDTFNAGYEQAHIHIIELISILKPAEEAKEKSRIAHWKSVRVDKRHYNYYCDHCYKKSEFRKSRYCPECGYLMEEK